MCYKLSIIKKPVPGSETGLTGKRILSEFNQMKEPL